MATMTDNELIGYCEIHCETERALFSGVHINRMIELAGCPPDFPAGVPPDIFLSAQEEMAELCALARARREVFLSVAEAREIARSRRRRRSGRRC